MRDPARIDDTLEVLRMLWKRCPDQRLGQLIDNATFHRGHTIFNIEDDQMYLDLQKFLAKVEE